MLATLSILAIGQALAADSPANVFNVHELDPKISACTDFNGFVNAKWIAANPIPADRTRWGAFDQLREKSLEAQRTIALRAETDAARAKPGSVEQKIGWFYHSGMDEKAIDARGFDPIRQDLAMIAALDTPTQIAAWINRSFAEGWDTVFHFGAQADYKNAAQQIGYANQGGLGLPTPDYYTEDKYAELRQAYAAHIARMFELIGVPADEARAKADRVLAIETRLAKASLSRVALRDPANRYHFMSIAEANAATPNFDWNAFFSAIDVAPGTGFSLGQPGFFTEFGKMLTDVPAADWRDYLAFHRVDDAAPMLSKPFQEESFAFYGKTLNGQPELSPRWKRVLGAINNGIGEGLGQLYVAEYFPPAAKQRAQQLVENVRLALRARIEHLDWMSDATKAKALEKWSTFLPKIGYPDKWRSWDGLEIRPDDYAGNVRRAIAFNARYDFDKIGKPTDRYEWGMTPQTVNAYYSPTTNTINFPAAILQPPFFYADGDDAINYGGIGAVIGHEASHGFDDQGSKFDAQGNNRNWWTDEDRAKFEQRSNVLVQQFDAYAPLPDHPDAHVNGRLTLGENIADLGGLSVAYDALQMALKQAGVSPQMKIDGYTEDQRFFLNWARVWRGSIREKAQLVLLNTDPHAPAQFRAAGAPSNLTPFAQAFQCQAGDAMVRSGDKQVKIW
jgi:putative endopeptidase